MRTKLVFGQFKNLVLPFIYKNSLLRNIVYPGLKNVYLEVTNKCNLQCKMCMYSKMKQATGYMSRQIFENCVDQLSEIGVENLYLHFGGESLVHPDFKQFLKYAVTKRDQGKIGAVSWIDNGMLFNQAISDLVVELKVDSIGFSIDGVGKVNDNIRIGASYSTIEQNIKYLVKKRGSAKKPEIHLSTCDFGKTEEQELDVYREWVQFVDSITLVPSILPDNTWENKSEISGKFKMREPPAFCSFPFETMAISWDGKVTGCCLDYVFEMELGDAKKESLKKIWRGPRYQALRLAALKNNFPNGSLCHTCEFWKINFDPCSEPILKSTATMDYGYIYRVIKRNKEHRTA